MVITIHDLPDVEHPWVNTPVELFKEHLQYLDKNNFKVIAIKDLKDYIDTKAAKKKIHSNVHKN